MRLPRRCGLRLMSPRPSQFGEDRGGCQATPRSKAGGGLRLVPKPYPLHMPRRGAPQGHGPASATVVAVELEEADTAKTESNCSTLRLWQLSQTTFSAAVRTIFSNWAPHSRHRYSKIGMRITLRPGLNRREFDFSSSGSAQASELGGSRGRRSGQGFQPNCGSPARTASRKPLRPPEAMIDHGFSRISQRATRWALLIAKGAHCSPPGRSQAKPRKTCRWRTMKLISACSWSLESPLR